MTVGLAHEIPEISRFAALLENVEKLESGLGMMMLVKD